MNFWIFQKIFKKVKNFGKTHIQSHLQSKNSFFQKYSKIVKESLNRYVSLFLNKEKSISHDQSIFLHFLIQLHTFSRNLFEHVLEINFKIFSIRRKLLVLLFLFFKIYRNWIIFHLFHIVINNICMLKSFIFHSFHLFFRIFLKSLPLVF